MAHLPDARPSRRCFASLKFRHQFGRKLEEGVFGDLRLLWLELNGGLVVVFSCFVKSTGIDESN